jgi:phospholipid/cholesterol/gamma-HCH transport system substrate-binding protein
METRANYVAVGIFTLVALFAAAMFVYWTARYGGNTETARLIIRIPGSATGLDKGSFVRFNGVRVGDVRNVFIDVTNPKVANVEAVISRLTPITATTRATITLTGLTGAAEIELKGGDPEERNIFDIADEKGEVAVIDAEPSAVTNILETVQDIAARADKTLVALQSMFDEARAPLLATAKNAETFSKALADNAGNIDAFLKSFDDLSKTITSVSGKLEATLDSATGLLDAVDRDQVAQIVSNTRDFTQKLDTMTGKLDGVIAGVDATVANLVELSGKAGATLGRVDGAIDQVSETLKKADAVVAAVDPTIIGTAVDDLAAAGANVRKTSEAASAFADRVLVKDGEVDAIVASAKQAVANVEEFTEGFSGRKDDVDAIIANSRQLTERLNAASVRIDGVLAKVDNLLGAEGGGDLIAEARSTLVAFRDVANNLNQRITVIAGGIEQFTGRGLKQIENLAQDSRRSIQRIEETITELGNNPQRIITGGSGDVRQFDGRARR